MKKKGILFDKDGTLISLSEFWKLPVKKLAGKVAFEYGFSDDRRKQEKLLMAAGIDGSGRIIPDSPLAAGTNRDIGRGWEKLLRLWELRDRRSPLEEREAFAARLADELADMACCFGEVRPLADLRRLCGELSHRGYVLGIATADSPQTTRYCLESLGILGSFAFLGTAEQDMSPKPSPDMMEAFCQTCGLDAEQVYMVGDSLNDMLFAKNSGARGLFLSQDERPDLPPGAVARLRRLDELAEILH